MKLLRAIFFHRIAYCVTMRLAVIGGLPMIWIGMAFRGFDARVPWAEDWALRDVTLRAEKKISP